MVISHEPDFSSSNASTNNDNIDQANETANEPQQEMANSEAPTIQNADVSTTATAAVPAAPAPENNGAAIISSGIQTTSPRFGLTNRRYNAAGVQDTQMPTQLYANTPDFFNQATESIAMAEGQQRTNSKKKRLIIGAVCVAALIIAIVAIGIALNPATRNPLIASGGLKEKFYGFANKFLNCEDKNDALSGEYDSKKSYCASGAWNNNDYVASVKAKYDDFYKKYSEEKGKYDAYQDIMFELDAYMKFLFTWQESADISETQFSTYYLKYGHEATIKHFYTKIDEQFAGDSGKIIGYREYAKERIAGLADKYAVYVANGCFGGLGKNISTCASGITGESLTKLNQAMAAADEGKAGMVNVREGAFIYTYKQLFALSDIMEGKQ